MTANQEAWLQALESGEFSQTHGWLQDEKGFCCLGVACVVADRAGVQVIKSLTGGVVGASLYTQAAVFDWLGLRDQTGVPKDYDPVNNRSLTYYNDHVLSFKEIAKLIRAHPELYFKESNVDRTSGEVVEGPRVGGV